ncbi:MAG: DNA polymerase III subunit delta [Nitrosomonas sp.]|nr:DNA polymerase III subunit delta [Nitrosomonas sp.]
MQIKADQLVKHLQKHLAPLYTVFGAEPLLVAETTDHIRNKAREKGFSEHERFTVDTHFRWTDLLNASNSQSLFGDRKIIDVRIPSGKPGKEGGKALENYCQTLPQDAITLITLPRLDKQSQSAKWFKTLESKGVMIPIYAMEQAQLPVWIKNRLALQQQSIDQETLLFIASQVEGNLLAAKQEIQKLALLYPPGNLTFEQVKNAIFDVSRYDVYQLTDALIAANTVRYTRILNGLQSEGMALPLILTVVSEQIRQLIFLRKGLNQGIPANQLLKSARIWGERQNIAINAAKRITIERLLQSLLHAAKIDQIIKGMAKGNPKDAWHELLLLGLNLTTKHAR